jgi:uncharacterized protein YecE (DUF72 family)
VGTSGFVYDHWDGPFYPRASDRETWLELYAQTFSTVELNVTFYRLPPASTFDRWRERVPAGFLFAVKASRYLTHVRRLKSPRPAVDLLMERATRLGDRLGAILLQLPPDMPIDLERLDSTLAAFGEGVRLAVEPRHDSWFTDDCRDLLARHRAALCLADRHGPRTPLWATTDWTYLRLHGGRASPPSCYGPSDLEDWVRRLTDGSLARRGYVYFNNDAHACAIRNAVELARLLQ